MHSRKLLPWYDSCSCTTLTLSHSWKIPKKLGLISLQRRYKKRHQNQVFSIRRAYFWKNNPQSPILRGFGEDFYALWSFTGQQYFFMYGLVWWAIRSFAIAFLIFRHVLFLMSEMDYPEDNDWGTGRQCELTPCWWEWLKVWVAAIITVRRKPALIRQRSFWPPKKPGATWRYGSVVSKATSQWLDCDYGCCDASCGFRFNARKALSAKEYKKWWGFLPIGRIPITRHLCFINPLCCFAVAPHLTSSLKKYAFYNLLINNILYLCVT